MLARKKQRVVLKKDPVISNPNESIQNFSNNNIQDESKSITSKFKSNATPRGFD